MESKIKHYNFSRGWGHIEDPTNPDVGIFFHISDVKSELAELFDAKKFHDEPVTFKTRPSKVKEGQLEAYDVNLDLNQRSLGYIVEFDRNKGFGRVEEFTSKERYFVHFTKIRGADQKFISMEIGDPVIFVGSENGSGKQALDVVKVDSRNQLEAFADFEDFNQSLLDLQSIAEPEHWDYIKNPTSRVPVLYSYINYTFERIMAQKKLVKGISKEKREYAYFNTGLVTPFQDEIYGYFEKVSPVDKTGTWHIPQPEYVFQGFETDQSHFRKYFSSSPEMATYFTEAEVTELMFDTSLNQGKIIVDREHLMARKKRFPAKIAALDDEAFLDAIAKSIDLAIKRAKRNYKTAIPHFYDGKIQFLLPLCMLTKKDADLALVVNKEESVYTAHTVLTLDQAYNNARLLAKPDREWLNP